VTNSGSFVIQEEVDAVDDADDGGVDRSSGPVYRPTRAPAIQGYYDPVSYSGVERVKRQKALPQLPAVEVQGLNPKNLPSGVAVVLLGGHNLPDYARENHG